MNLDALVKTLQLCTAKVIERANIEGRFARNTAVEPDGTMRVTTYTEGFRCMVVRVTTQRWLFSTYIKEEL